MNFDSIFNFDKLESLNQIYHGQPKDQGHQASPPVHQQAFNFLPPTTENSPGPTIDKHYYFAPTDNSNFQFMDDLHYRPLNTPKIPPLLVKPIEKPVPQMQNEEMREEIVFMPRLEENLKLSLPPEFDANVTINKLSGSSYHKLDLPANLLYPDVDTVRKTLNSEGFGNTANHLSPELKIQFIRFAKTQVNIINAFCNENTENIEEKLFQFFAKSLQMDFTLYQGEYKDQIRFQANKGVDFKQKNIFLKSHSLQWINLFPYYYLWKLAVTNDQKNSLVDAIRHTFRFLRPVCPLNNFNLPIKDATHTHTFLQWIQSIVNEAIKETSYLQDVLLPKSAMTEMLKTERRSGSHAFDDAIAQFFFEDLKSEVNQIAEADIARVIEIYNILSFKTPFCGEIESTEYLLSAKEYKNKGKINCLSVYPFEVHSTPFFLTYISRKNVKHHWGHQETQKVAISTLNKQLKVSFSAPTKPLQSFIELKDQKPDLVEWIDTLINNTDIFHKLGVQKYTTCLGDCRRQVIRLNAVVLGAIPSSEELQWSQFSAEEKQIVCTAWKTIFHFIQSSNFVTTFTKYLYYKDKSFNSRRMKLEFNISNRDNHNLFFPALAQALSDELYENLKPCCFVIDRFIKIFNISCNDKEGYVNYIAVKEEEKELGRLIAHFSPLVANSGDNKRTYGTGNSVTLKTNTDFIYQIKKNEVAKYFTELEELDAEPNLSFDDKNAILVFANHHMASAALISHEFGFSYMSYSTNPKVQNFCERNKDNTNKISALFKFINECWKNGDFIIPIFEKKMLSTTSTDIIKGKKGRIDRNLEKGSKNSQLRRKKLRSNTKALDSYIEKHREQSNRNQKTNNTVDESMLSMLALPNFLIDFKLQNFNDIFCNIAKEMMIEAWREDATEHLNGLMNSASLQLLDPPEQDALLVEEKHRKTALIDTLYPYQKDTVAKFEVWKETNCGGIIADEPGLGKTVQGCEIILRSLIEHPDQPCIVIAPQLVKSHWAEEFWQHVNASAERIATKAYRNASDPEQRKQARQILRKLASFEGETFPEITLFSSKHQIILSDEEADRLEKLAQFYGNNSLEDFHVLKNPEDFRNIIQRSQEGPIKGVIIAQYSYFNKQFDIHVPNKFKALNPSIAIIDEAHELLSMEESSKKLGKTTIFDYIFRGWECPKLGLTATPLINDVYDVTDLLMILTNTDRNFQSADHFEKLIFELANHVIAVKNDYEKGSEDSSDIDLGDFWIKSNVRTVTSALQKTLFAYLWLKEKVINPRIQRTTRDKSTTPSSITKKEFSFKIIPHKEQLELHQVIYDLYNTSFFKFTTLVSTLLIHPDLIVKDKGKYRIINQRELDKRLKSIKQMDEKEINRYIKRSGLLRELFLTHSIDDSQKTIADAMANGERAILFVAQKVQAEFLKVLAQKKFELSDTQIFAVHSGNNNSEADIASFKSLKTKGICILLPKSGGAGLNFTTVALNILCSVGWTHKDEEQCGNRISRGLGVKHIGTVSYPFKSAVHVKNIILKKELYSDLYLEQTPIEEENMMDYLQKILETSLAMIGAQLDHCDPSENWKNFLNDFLGDIQEGLGSPEALWQHYTLLKEQTKVRILKENTVFVLDNNDHENVSRKKPRVEGPAQLAQFIEMGSVDESYEENDDDETRVEEINEEKQIQMMQVQEQRIQQQHAQMHQHYTQPQQQHAKPQCTQPQQQHAKPQCTQPHQQYAQPQQHYSQQQYMQPQQQYAQQQYMQPQQQYAQQQYMQPQQQYAQQQYMQPQQQYAQQQYMQPQQQYAQQQYMQPQQQYTQQQYMQPQQQYAQQQYMQQSNQMQHQYYQQQYMQQLDQMQLQQSSEMQRQYNEKY